MGSPFDYRLFVAKAYTTTGINVSNYPIKLIHRDILDTMCFFITFMNASPCASKFGSKKRINILEGFDLADQPLYILSS